MKHRPLLRYLQISNHRDPCKLAESLKLEGERVSDHVWIKCSKSLKRSFLLFVSESLYTLNPVHF